MLADAQAEPFTGRECSLLAGESARAIAEAYLADLTAFWLGTSWQRPFADWLAGYWQATMPPRDDWAAVVISPHGGGGRGIVWYETDQAMLGYVPGVPGGYQIPYDDRTTFAISPHCPGNQAKAFPTTTA